MNSSVIHKGVNKPMKFKGLSKQYIIWAAGVTIGCLILMVVLLACRVNPYLTILTFAGLFGLSMYAIFYFHDKYGEHGLSLTIALRMQPRVIENNSPDLWLNLHSDENKQPD